MIMKASSLAALCRGLCHPEAAGQHFLQKNLGESEYEKSIASHDVFGVEFIILASALPANSAPEVDGHLMNYIDAPNRYGIPVPFFELHVWAWRENPQGPFVDWNDHVTCANH